MKYDDILKIWATIDALTEQKAKLALFGLVIQKLGQGGETFDEEEVKRILEAIHQQRSEGE